MPANPLLSSFDPGMPWNSFIRVVAVFNEFWEKELKEPALNHKIDSRRNRAPADEDDTRKRHPVFKAMSNIKAGSEILHDYGEEYWQTRDVDAV